MNQRHFRELALYLGILFILSPVLGSFMARVFEGKSNPLSFLLRPIEKSICSLGSVDPKQEMNWVSYAVSLVVFNLAG